MSVPEASLASSKAFQFIQSQGWTWRNASSPNIEVEHCPYCKCGNYHLRMEIHGADDPQINRDSLHLCMKCGKGGSLHSLKQHLGLVSNTLESRKDYASSEKKVEAMPDIQSMHEALLADEDALDYLMNGRGFSREVIERQKLGLHPKRYFRETGEVRALVYPYLVNGNAVFAHFRTLPDMNNPGKVPKAFSSLTGWDVPLYNGEILRDGLTEVFMVEGEANCIAAMDKGVENICGVPGANFKKAEWIGTLDKLGLDKIYICYDKDKVGQKAAQELAKKIGLEKCWKISLPDFDVTTDEGETRKGKDLNEYFAKGGGTAESFDRLKEEAVLFDVDGVASSRDSLQEFEDELNGKEGLEPKYKTQWPSLNKYVGFEEGDVIDILAPEKVGKGGLLTTPVKTINGWKNMGDLVVGDKLASVDGAPSEVTGVYPRGILPMYKVTFADGRSTVTTADHLWKVAGATEWERQKWRIYTTDAIANEYAYAGNRRSQKLFIPLCSGEFGTDDLHLPIDPWALGALIGDGSFTESGVSYCSADRQLVLQMRELYNLSESKGINYNLGKDKELVKNLKHLGLYGKTSESKFIPKMYLESTRGNRVRLLQGLMDTDGTASNRNGVISYCTVSKQLAEDMVYLVRSLGGMAKVGKPQKKSFRYKGELRQGLDAYIIVVRLPHREEAFTLQRKLDRLQPRRNEPRLTFSSIEYVGEHEAVCISVSHPSKLYITDDFIVTHNSTVALNLIEHMVDTYGEDGVFICLEMTRSRMARKWVALLGQVADTIPKTTEEGIALANEFKAVIPRVKQVAANRDGDLYFAYPRYKTTEDIYTLMRDCIRRYGVKWIVIDNIQRLADTTPRGKNSRVEHLSEISKTTSQIAKDYNIQMVRILQPHRIAAGQMVTTDNVDGASQIAKDCDCMITAHRSKIGQITQDQFDAAGYVEQEASMGTDILLNVGLSRYSSGGMTTLYFDGARSTVRELTATQVARIQRSANANVGYEAQMANLGITPAGSGTGAVSGVSGVSGTASAPQDGEILI